MTVALTAAAGIIAALCLGLATTAGVAAAALADILACAAIALAVASYTTAYPACSRLPATSRAGRRPATREPGIRSWERDTLDELDWAWWEREVFGPHAPGTSRRRQPDTQWQTPPPGPSSPRDEPGDRGTA
jgi:hypothetical protein